MSAWDALELHEMRDGVLMFRDGDQPCPGCSASITFITSNEGQSVDVLHPQPPCDEFRAFVERLQAAHREHQKGHA